MEEKKLNRRETFKARQRPYDYFVEEFEKLDFENLGEGDRYFLQDFGIFNTEFLEDEFTIRIRIPAGRISLEDFEAIAKIVDEYDLTIVLTARGGVQLHDVYVDDILEIWKKINALGVTTWQSFGDNVRNIVSDPLDGVAQDSVIEVFPYVKEMQDFIVKNPDYVGLLPRRVSIGISGNHTNIISFFANDIYFGLAKKGDQYGFNIYMGGKNTEVAQDMDIFITKEEVIDFYKAFLQFFNKYGSRYSRSKTRLFYYIEEHGKEKLKERLLEFFPKESFETAGELQLQKGEFKRFHQLKDGSYSFTYQTNFSKLEAQEMLQIAAFAKENAKEIRFGVDQNIHIIGLKEPKADFESKANSSTVIACAGNLCPYAVWSIKGETKYLPLELIEKHSVYVGFSGCAKGCGRHRHTDIGLIGLKTNNFGDVEGGCRIFLGAEHSYGKAVGRELFSMVPFPHLNTVITLIINLYTSYGFKDFEEYARKVLNLYSNRFLAVWHIANLEFDEEIALPIPSKMMTIEEEKALLKETFKDFELVEDDFFKTISQKAKELWTIEGKDPRYKPAIKRTAFR